MSTATIALTNQRVERTPGHTATIYLIEAKYEFLKNLRLRMYTASVLSFPIMFYVLFGLVRNQHQSIGGTSVPAYLIATYGTFGVMGASLFGTAAGLASDRGLGWLQDFPDPSMDLYRIGKDGRLRLAVSRWDDAEGICMLTGEWKDMDHLRPAAE